MEIRLKITGGFGGPATWSDLSLNPDMVGQEKFTEIEAMLKAALLSQQSVQTESGFFADGQTYTFELDCESGQQQLTVTEARITDEIRDIVQLMKQCESQISDAKKEDKSQ